MTSRRRGPTGTYAAGVVAAVAAFVAVLSSCGVGSDAPTVDVRGDWGYVDGRTADGDLVALSRDFATLSLGDGTARGFGGCNGYGTDVDLDADQIRFGDIEQTLMGCDDPAGGFERRFLDALAEVTTARREGSTLVLTGDDVTLEFGPLPVWPEKAVTGRVWKLRQLSTDPPTAASSRAEGEPAVLYLGTNGTLTARTGCRGITGTWEHWNGDVVLTSSQMRGTCTGQERQQDAAVTSVLSRFTAEVRVRQGRHELVLTARASDEAGVRQQLVYQR